MRVGDFTTYGAKSSIKAGAASAAGRYMFFTSSSEEDKRCDEYQFDCEGIIMGTGGNATLHYFSGKFAVSTDCVVLFPDERVRCKYLYYFFLANMRLLEAGFKGAGLRHTNKNYISNIEFGDIPPISKQEEIITVLDSVFRIQLDRKKALRFLDTLIKARFVEMFGDPAFNEKGWNVINLENVTTIVTYGLTVRPEYIDEGIDLVSARELHKGYVAYEEAPKISLEDFEGLSDKGKPQKNDILFSKTGSIGHCALVVEDKPFAITQNAARIGLNREKTNPLWMLYYLRMDYIQNWCRNHAKGNAVKDFQLQDMKVIPLFECPLELQDNFTEFVKYIDKSKVIVQKALDEAQLLFDSLMQKYFG